MVLGVGIGSLIGGASPHIAKLLGNQSFQSTTAGGAGTLLTGLAGSFPIGFLGGAGYGSGLRFGFEKLFDSTFKNMQSPIDVVKIMQGGFNIGNAFAQEQKGNDITQAATTTPPSQVGSDLTSPTILTQDIQDNPVQGPTLDNTGFHALHYTYMNPVTKVENSHVIKGSKRDIINKVQSWWTKISNPRSHSATRQVLTAQIGSIQKVFHQKFGDYIPLT